MSAIDSEEQPASAKALTAAACASFVPVGLATVLLGPMLPILSARWSLNYAQAGALFTAQYIVATCAVALSGMVVSLRGYRFAINTGLLLIAAGLACLLSGGRVLGIICIGAYGAGLGFAVPAANLLVAEVNPKRRSASLNSLNFFWSAGAVSCPFLVAAAVKFQRISIFLWAAAAFCVLLIFAIAMVPENVANAAGKKHHEPGSNGWRSQWVSFVLLGALFCIYVGTENCFGGWVASYAKSFGSFTPWLALITPSFFYAALMLGRLLAPLILRAADELTVARGGLLLSCVGAAGLLISKTLTAVILSACAAGLGLSSIYPITIALLSYEFGSSSSKAGSVMFTLSNIGGGLLPWAVGLFSSKFGTIKVGLVIPMVGCAVMLALYLRTWGKQSDEQGSALASSN
jgi:FHS family glucose/mannose:H+ symporter-like MFS transporter